MASVIFISFVISFCPLQYEELFSQSDLASSNARQNYPQILHLLIFIFIFFRFIRKKVTSYGLWIFRLFCFLTRKMYCVLSQGTFFKEKAYPWILQCLSSASCSHDGVYALWVTVYCRNMAIWRFKLDLSSLTYVLSAWKGLKESTVRKTKSLLFRTNDGGAFIFPFDVKKSFFQTVSVSWVKHMYLPITFTFLYIPTQPLWK